MLFIIGCLKLKFRLIYKDSHEDTWRPSTLINYCTLFVKDPVLTIVWLRITRDDEQGDDMSEERSSNARSSWLRMWWSSYNRDLMLVLIYSRV